LLNLYKPTVGKSTEVSDAKSGDEKVEVVEPVAEPIISTPLTIFDEGKSPHDSPPVVESPPAVETPQPLVASKRRSRVSK
jgi:hypothetical protein